jgi:hypothetical protein
MEKINMITQHAVNNGYPNGQAQTTNVSRRQSQLDQAVADGQLTSAQEQMIENEYKSMRQSKGSSQNLTASQRRQDRHASRQQMLSWAQSENIPTQFVN